MICGKKKRLCQIRRTKQLPQVNVNVGWQSLKTTLRILNFTTLNCIAVKNMNIYIMDTSYTCSHLEHFSKQTGDLSALSHGPRMATPFYA